MNKKLKVLPVLAMGLMLVACNGGTSSSSKPTSKNDDVNFTLKVGSYVAMAGEDNPNTIEVSTAAVILKGEKIVDAYFDVLQAPFKIDSTTDKKDEDKVTYTVSLDTTKNQTKDAGDKVIETKQELKTRYGMASTAAEGEWNVQAANFAKYTVGKTIDEVTSKNYKSNSNKNGTEVVTGCSISQKNFTTALKVITDTKTFKAPAGKVSAGLGYKVSALSKDNVLTVTLAGSATDKEGKIYETSINAYQIPVTVNGSSVTNPKIAIDTTKTQTKAENFKGHTVESEANKYYTSVLSKRELKELYAMKENTEDAQKMEWYNQANNFAKYAKGKIASEIAGKSYKPNLNHDGTVEVPGCTINMEDFAVAIGKSATNKSGLTAK
ncbi:MAG: hypothetical protein V8R16_06670 [Bacilli bacterium]